MGRVIDATPRPLYFRKRPGTHCIGGWVGHRAGLEGVENLAHISIQTPDSPNRSKSPYRLSYPGPQFYTVKYKPQSTGKPIPVAARSYKRRSAAVRLQGSGSNPAGGIYVCFLCMLFAVRYTDLCDGRSLIQRSPTEFSLSQNMIRCNNNPLHL